MLEALEPRELLAAAVTASLGTNGTLTIEGTDGPDTIALWQTQGRLVVNGVSIQTPTGLARFVSTTQVQAIVINTHGGNDTVELNTDRYGFEPIRQPATINGGNGNDYIASGWGPTLIHAGDGNNTLVGGAGSDTLQGGAGNDVLYGGSGGGVLSGGGGVNFFDLGGGNPRLVETGTLDFVATRWAEGGAQPQDVHQENAPTCAFLASLAALAWVGRGNLAGGISYLGSGLYGVRLFEAGATAGTGHWVTEYVNFDGDLTAQDPQPVSGGKFWVVLYQRAWNEMRASEQLSSAAWPDETLTALTGSPAYGYLATTVSAFLQTVNTGWAMVASTWWDASKVSPLLIPNHAYTVLGMDNAGNVYLYNPWGIDGGTQPSGVPGDGIVTISLAEFERSMYAFWIG
jgi:hypothetical protein